MTGRTAAELAARYSQRAAAGANPERRRYERDLVLLYQRNRSAREAVVRAFRPLAASVARRYYRGQEPLEDLEQVAMLGLVKALERFDPLRGAPFVTYALPTMTGEVRRHYRDTGWAVHVTRGAQELAQKVAAHERAHAGHLTARDCADQLGLAVEDVVEARNTLRAMRADSLDSPPPGQTGSPTGSSRLPAREDDAFRAVEARATIGRLTRDLPERERRIITLRYSGDLSQAEIGRRVGLSQMHVSRVLRRTLSELHRRATSSDSGFEAQAGTAGPPRGLD